MSALGDYMRQLRKKRGLLLKQVSYLTQERVSVSCINQIELGRIERPSLERLRALAEVYGVSAASLFLRFGYLTQADLAEASQLLAELPQPEEETPGWDL